MMAVVMHLGRIAHVSRSEGLKPCARDSTSTKRSSRPYSCMVRKHGWYLIITSDNSAVFILE